MNLNMLHKIRDHELKIALSDIKDKNLSSLLEIGSGTGHQLSILKKNFSNCFGIDLEDGTYRTKSTSDVIIYDGSNIPFKNSEFDIVFSSNTLEHVVNIAEFEVEIQRVLKSNGFALHILPTQNWVIFTIFTHPLFIFKTIAKKFFLKKLAKKIDVADLKESTTHNKTRMTFFEKILNILLPKTHGTKGNFLTEFFYFSEFYWRKHFSKSGWKVIKVSKSGLAYSGNQIFPDMPFKLRKNLSLIIGSSTKVYLLKKN